ncbi:hypothetical protein AVEN_162874-1 [Araneus ventricosus]|uniref:Uncharacterized protein n=1 Tax=Araneus ventricosus TaxID=182803 RepID=A0A4Y2TCI8_ARAVE|nr:hypothetical protein AVEN_162874-1 [Araneus ventricosus]
MNYILSFFRFPGRKSPKKRKPQKKVEKLSDQSTSNAESEPADKGNETNWTSIDAYIRRFFGFAERKSAQQRKREENDEVTDRSTSNAEGKQGGKKK